MAVSMRQVASGCLGATGNVSMRREIFGYIFGPPNRPYSLKLQLDRAKGRAFNFSAILVGHRDDFSGTISRADVTRITYAIQRTRELYAQVNLGIRKVFWTHISEDDVGGYTVITDADEAENLTEDWSADNNGIDVFYVQSILNAGGWSTQTGPCDKSDKGFTGAVVELSGSDEITGILTAHEVGHYLGLGTGPNANNVMGVDSNNDGIDEIGTGSVNLTSGQGSTMRSHCSTHGSC